jgi:hypothetical protein
MRHYILLSAFIFSSIISYAQDTSFLRNFNSSRVNTTKNAMLVLGGWGIANITVGLIGNSRTTGETKYIHQMNAIWGVVNLGIATASYFGKRSLTQDLQGSIKEQRKIEKIYLINGGLDLAYIAGGLLLRQHGNNKLPGKDQDKWKGYGASIIGQGVFLLLYDGVNFTIHRQHGKQLFSQFKDVALSVYPGGVSTQFKF